MKSKGAPKQRPDPEHGQQRPPYTPQYRASRAKQGLDAYSRRYEDEDADAMTIVADFLADLMHLADVERFDFGAALDRARYHHMEEVAEHARGVSG